MDKKNKKIDLFSLMDSMGNLPKEIWQSLTYGQRRAFRMRLAKKRKKEDAAVMTGLISF
jgi:hypothetical protein